MRRYAPYRDPHQKLTVPNVLSVFALLCGLGVLWRAGFENDLRGGMFFLLVGACCCVLDGITADWFKQHTELGDKQLQPLAGLSLGAAAVFSLCRLDYWPDWLGWMLLGIMVVFQFISFFAKRMPRVKRHQFWMHPIFSVGVTFAALMSFMMLDPDDRPSVAMLVTAVAVILIVVRWRRYLEWFAGPEGQK